MRRLLAALVLALVPSACLALDPPGPAVLMRGPCAGDLVLVLPAIGRSKFQLRPYDCVLIDELAWAAGAITVCTTSGQYSKPALQAVRGVASCRRLVPLR